MKNGNETAVGIAPKPAGALLTKEEVGVLLGFSRRHIDNLMRAGLPHMRFGRRRTRFNREEVLAWCGKQFGTQRRGPLVAPVLPEQESASPKPSRKPRQPRKSAH